jgi:CTP:molybdopterin cytidylyltransferase MocA
MKDASISAILVSLVDLPGITASAIKAVMESEHDLLVATFDGAKGHPVKFSRSHWQGIIDSAQGDVGARNYLATRDDVFYLPLETLASGSDLDTPEDLARSDI